MEGLDFGVYFLHIFGIVFLPCFLEVCAERGSDIGAHGDASVPALCEESGGGWVFA